MFLKTSVDLQTALAAETHSAEEQRLKTERLSTHVPSRITNTDCLKNRLHNYLSKIKRLCHDIWYARPLHFSNKLS
jgi:hypothetical protein